MKPVAIVIPWFDPDLTGGAEQQAFQVATRLAARHHAVEVLSTCNRSFQSDWSANHHAPGTIQYGDLTIRRFPVDSRDAAAFDQVNAKLLTLEPSTLRPGVNPVSAEDARTFVDKNIRSASLLEYLQAEHDTYQAFIFLPYMFAPIMLGALQVADRAWLQPCLHDESAAYLPQTAELFRRVRGILFNSEGEMELALRLYGPGVYERSTVVGEGIEHSYQKPEEIIMALPSALRGKRFVLYLGRRDRLKNVDLLANAFAQFKAAQPESALQLVLAGPGVESFAGTAGIQDLGLVSNDTKAALLASASALAQPSRNESFSRAIMEAWAAGRPVAAHRECLATALAVQRAEGGWTPGSETEWTQLFAHIAAASDEELNELGERGRNYVGVHADWDKVVGRYESLLGLRPAGERLPLQARWKADGEVPRVSSTKVGELRAIHQLLPDFLYGDAISNQASAIRNYLRQQGYESEIFAKRRDQRMTAATQLFDEVQPGPEDGLLYHHSIGSELTAFAIAHEGSKCLIYHNITPAEYFVPYRPGFAWMLETGRANLKRLARHFALSVGDSAYNADELVACGFQAPGVLPIIVDPNKWNIAPDEELMARLQDGKTNLLFVGRIAPNKKQDRLVEAFAHYRALNPHSRLIIVGEARAIDPYSVHFLNTIARLDLAADVEVTGQVDDSALLAYYRAAHLYWSPSEHEGFGAPLIEAMWFDVPVLALSAAAVPETLSGSGVLFAQDDALQQVATRAYQFTHEANARQVVIERQRKRRLDFTPTAVRPILDGLIERFVAAPGLAVAEGR
jgi:glycosyltransferase involved in cell wall biosynthesis